MIYLGDFPADQAIYFAWNTNDGDGASITRSTDGTISVYKDASNGTAFDTTQVTTGVTNDEDFDALVGVHTCCIVTTNAWYETGHDYIVVLSASTIDTQSVSAVLAHFSIENRNMRGTDSANTTTPPTVIAIREEMDSNSTKMAPSQTLNDYKATGFNTTTPPTVGEIRTEMEGAGHNLALIIADTNELQGDWTNAGRLDAILDIIAADTTTDIPAILTLMSGATFATGTDSLEAIRNRGDAEWITAVGFNTVVPDAAGVAPTAAENADALWDEVLTGLTHNVANSAGKRLREMFDAGLYGEETAQGGTASTITLAATASALDDFYNTMVLTIIDGTGAGQIRTFKDYVGATRVATACRDWIVTPDNTSKYVISASACSAVYAMDTEVYDLIKAECGTALTDYDPPTRTEATADVATIIADLLTIKQTAAGTYDRATDSLQAIRDQGDSAWITGGGGTAPTVGEIRTEMEGAGHNLALIIADTNELQGDWTNAGRLDAILDIIAADTTTDIPAILTLMSGATFATGTDSLEAIRNRGDAAWSAAAGNPSVLIDTTAAVITDQTHFTLTAGSDIDDAYKDQAIVLYDASNSDYPSVRKVSAYTGATKTITLDSAPDFTIVNGDGVKTFVTAPGTTAPTAAQNADAVWDEAKVDHPDPLTFGGQNSFVNG